MKERANRKSLIIKLILGISVCINLILLGVIYFKKVPNDFTGTYICETTENPGDSLYLVIDKNGDYLLYRQFKEISRGKYLKQDEKIYWIENVDGIKQYIVYDGRDTAYCFLNPDGQVYKRINNKPMYINLETETQEPESEIEREIVSPPASSPAEKEDNTPNAAVPGLSVELSNDAFQAYLDDLASGIPDGGPVTLNDVAQFAPELADEIDKDPAAVSLLCFSDLLAVENIEPIRDYINRAMTKTPPPERLRVECALLQCVAETYEPSFSEMVAKDDDDAYSWLSDFYRFDMLKRCKEYGTDPEGDYYLERPIRRQFLIAMLREPGWRLPLTPLTGELFDQDSYINASNCFGDYMLFGKQPSQLSIEPGVDAPGSLCSETAVWTLRQAEDFTVTLDVEMGNGSAVTLTYAP